MTDSPSDLSILIPLYNAAPYLEMAVQSIFRQNLPALSEAFGGAVEIVIVDDGSTDGSGAIARALAARYREIKLIEQENRGVSAARNVAVARSGGAILCFLDADDEYTEGALSFLLGELSRLRQQYGDLVMVRGALQLIARAPSGPDWVAQGEPRQLSVIHSCALTRATFDRVGAFDEELKAEEDADWLLRAADSGIVMPLTSHVVTKYRQHETNLTRDKAATHLEKIKMLKKMVARKHARRLQNAGQSNSD